MRCAIHYSVYTTPSCVLSQTVFLVSDKMKFADKTMTVAKHQGKIYDSDALYKRALKDR